MLAWLTEIGTKQGLFLSILLPYLVSWKEKLYDMWTGGKPGVLDWLLEIKTKVQSPLLKTERWGDAGVGAQVYRVSLVLALILLSFVTLQSHCSLLEHWLTKEKLAQMNDFNTCLSMSQMKTYFIKTKQIYKNPSIGILWRQEVKCRLGKRADLVIKQLTFFASQCYEKFCWCTEPLCLKVYVS